MKYAAEVTRGAAFLDAVAPGWEGRINLQTLDLESTYDCVCGQVFQELADKSPCDSMLPEPGYWWTTRNLLHEGAMFVRSHIKERSDLFPAKRGQHVMADLGFNVPVRDYGSIVTLSCDEWPLLREAWVALIKERYNTGALSDAT